MRKRNFKKESTIQFSFGILDFRQTKKKKEKKKKKRKKTKKKKKKKK